MKRSIKDFVLGLFSFAVLCAFFSCSSDADNSNEDIAKALILKGNPAGSVTQTLDTWHHEYREVNYGGADIGHILETDMQYYQNGSDSYKLKYNYENFDSTSKTGSCIAYIKKSDGSIIGKRTIEITINIGGEYEVSIKESKFSSPVTTETEADANTETAAAASYTIYRDSEFKEETLSVHYNPSSNYSVSEYKTLEYDSTGKWVTEACIYLPDVLTFNENNKTVSGTKHQIEHSVIVDEEGNDGKYDTEKLTVTSYTKDTNTDSYDFDNPTVTYYLYKFVWTEESETEPAMQSSYEAESDFETRKSRLSTLMTTFDKEKKLPLTYSWQDHEGNLYAYYTMEYALEPVKPEIDSSGATSAYYLSDKKMYLFQSSDSSKKYMAAENIYDHRYIYTDKYSSDGTHKWVYVSSEDAYYADDITSLSSSSVTARSCNLNSSLENLPSRTGHIGYAMR